MKDSTPAPVPDAAIGQAALKQAQLGEQWMSFAKEQFTVSQGRQAELDALTKTLTEQQIGIGSEAAANARADRARYKEKFLPVEDAFVEEAADYASPERQDAAAAEAKADVQRGAADARATAEREAASYGINPASGRFAGIQRSGELGTALASAGAQNTARRGVRDKGLALKADVVNLGRGLPAMAAAGDAAAIGAGNSVVGLNTNATQQFVNSTGIVGRGIGGAMEGYGTQANILQNQDNYRMDAWKTKQDNDSANVSGLFGAIGTGAGLIFSDEELKEDKAPIGEGEALEAVKAMPVEEWTYKEGVADGGRHVGPYAQDFARETGSGDGKTIPVQDAIGLSLKAIQDVSAKVDRLAAAVGLGTAAGPPVANDRKPVKKAAANDNPGAIGLGIKGAV